MKNSISLIVLLLGITNTIFAQDSKKISMTHSAWTGISFQQNGKTLKFGEIVPVVQTNDQAYKLIKSAKSSYDLSNVLGFAGGFMIGWPLGTSIGGGDPNWTLAAIGAGLVVIAIPIGNGAKNKAKSAIDSYNSSLETISQNAYKPRLEFASMKSGLGLRLTF